MPGCPQTREILAARPGAGRRAPGRAAGRAAPRGRGATGPRAVRDRPGSVTCSRTCPSSRATTSGCGRSPRRSCWFSTSSLAARRRGTTRLRLLDSTPVPCGASRETVKRSEFAGYAAYGYCASHSRYFWGFRLYLLCASDGMPIAFELAPANASERDVAAEMLDPRRQPRVHRASPTRASPAKSSKRSCANSHSASSSAPTAKTNQPRHGNLGGIRQWIESIIDTTKGQLSLERPRRPHPRRPHRPHRPTPARARRRPLAQLEHQPTRPPPHRL